MSPVDVRLPPSWRSLAGGRERWPLEGGDVREVLRRLVEQAPALAPRLMTSQGDLRSSVAVYVNDRDIRTLDRAATRLAEGDVLTLVPALAGG
jgi:molybdopterin converting factor small subunit